MGTLPIIEIKALLCLRSMVLSHFNITKDQLLLKHRGAPPLDPTRLRAFYARWIFTYLARLYTDASLPTISRLLSRPHRSHTTLIDYIHNMRNLPPNHPLWSDLHILHVRLIQEAELRATITNGRTPQPPRHPRRYPGTNPPPLPIDDPPVEPPRTALPPRRKDRARPRRTPKA